MEKKLTNSGPLMEPADKHSIYTMNIPLMLHVVVRTIYWYRTYEMDI
jgi:hypothetical protein